MQPAIRDAGDGQEREQARHCRPAQQGGHGMAAVSPAMQQGSVHVVSEKYRATAKRTARTLSNPHRGRIQQLLSNLRW
jgi:hypothetical protein